MEKAIIALITSAVLSYVGMAMAVFFDKPRLIDSFFLACMALGGVALVLGFVGMLLN